MILNCIYNAPYVDRLESNRRLIFINAIIMNLKLSGHGCHINNNFVGCTMYADDLIIISPSQSGQQGMLDVCVSTCENLSLKCNAKK